MTGFSPRSILSMGALFVLSFSARAQTTPAPATPAQTTPALATPAPAATVTPAATSAPVSAAPAKEVMLTPLLVPGSYAEYLTKRYANDREGRAVIHMFAKHHTGGFIWLGAGAAFLTLFATQAGTHTSSSGGTYTLTVSPLGYVIFVGLPVVLAINKLSRFGNQAMYQAFLDYDKTGTFPGYVATRVRGGDYQ